MTIRYTAIKAIQTQLETILISNGYNYDLGANVFIGIPRLDPSFDEFISMWPGVDEKNDNGFYAKWQFAIELKIEACKEISKESDDMELISQNMLSDVVKCLHKPSITGIDNSNIFYTGGGIETYPQPGETVLGVVANYELNYNTAAGDLTTNI